jgi:hypothetical protein
VDITLSERLRLAYEGKATAVLSRHRSQADLALDEDARVLDALGLAFRLRRLSTDAVLTLTSGGTVRYIYGSPADIAKKLRGRTFHRIDGSEYAPPFDVALTLRHREASAS